MFILLFSFRLFFHFFTCLLHWSIYILTQLWFLRWVHAHVTRNIYSAHFCSCCCTAAITQHLRTSFSTPIMQSYRIQIPSVFSYTGIFVGWTHCRYLHSRCSSRLGMRSSVSFGQKVFGYVVAASRLLSRRWVIQLVGLVNHRACMYQGADKSLARPGRKQVTATKL